MFHMFFVFLQKASPFKCKGAHVIFAPMISNMTLSLIKMFLPTKLGKRVSFLVLFVSDMVVDIFFKFRHEIILVFYLRARAYTVQNMVYFTCTVYVLVTLVLFQYSGTHRGQINCTDSVHVTRTLIPFRDKSLDKILDEIFTISLRHAFAIQATWQNIAKC